MTGRERLRDKNDGERVILNESVLSPRARPEEADLTFPFDYQAATSRTSSSDSTPRVSPSNESTQGTPLARRWTSNPSSLSTPIPTAAELDLTNPFDYEISGGTYHEGTDRSALSIMETPKAVLGESMLTLPFRYPRGTAIPSADVIGGVSDFRSDSSIRGQRQRSDPGQSPGMGEIDRRDITRVVSRDESACLKIGSSGYEESAAAAEEPKRRVQDHDQGGDIMQIRRIPPLPMPGGTRYRDCLARNLATTNNEAQYPYPVDTRLAPASVPDPCSPSHLPRSHVPPARVTPSLDLSAYHPLPRPESDTCVDDQTGGYEPEHFDSFSHPPPTPYDGLIPSDPSARQSGFRVQSSAISLSESIIRPSGGLPVADLWTRPDHIDSPSEETTPASEVPYSPPNGEGSTTGSVLPPPVAVPHSLSLGVGNWSVGGGSIESLPRSSPFEANTESRREESMNPFRIDRSLSERTLGGARVAPVSPKDWFECELSIGSEEEELASHDHHPAFSSSLPVLPSIDEAGKVSIPGQDRPTVRQMSSSRTYTEQAGGSSPPRSGSGHPAAELHDHSRETSGPEKSLDSLEDMINSLPVLPLDRDLLVSPFLHDTKGSRHTSKHSAPSHLTHDFNFDQDHSDWEADVLEGCPSKNHVPIPLSPSNNRPTQQPPSIPGVAGVNSRIGKGRIYGQTLGGVSARGEDMSDLRSSGRAVVGFGQESSNFGQSARMSNDHDQARGQEQRENAKSGIEVYGHTAKEGDDDGDEYDDYLFEDFDISKAADEINQAVSQQLKRCA